VESPQSLITIKQARKLLGKEGKNFSDTQLQRLISDYDEIASQIIRNHEVLKDS
jgi:hypothetical protein